MAGGDRPHGPVTPASGGDRVTLAVVAGAQGIGGEVRLKLFAESIASLERHERFEAGGCTPALVRIRPDKGPGSGMAVAKFAEVADRTAAEALRGTPLTVARTDLPTLDDGEFYISDLIGRPCVDTAGVALGSVVAVENFGAGDIIEIARPDGRTFMVPFSPAAVPEVGATVVIDVDFVA